MSFPFKSKPASAQTAAGRPVEAGGQAAGNPYLSARRAWNEHLGALVSSRQNWQIVAFLSLLIALAAIGGVIHIGSQSKFVPYVVEVDKLGQTVAVGPLPASSRVDPRVVRAAAMDWLSCARTVTPDVALQRKCVFRVYAMLAAGDPATAKMNEWLNESEDATPFSRAQKEMVSVDIRIAIPMTSDTWQIEWLETVRDRQGNQTGEPLVWRALVTTYQQEPSSSTPEEQFNNNPLGVYVRDFSWSRVQ